MRNGRKPRKENNLTEEPKSDRTREAIFARAQAGLKQIQRRCSEALEHLQHHEPVAALGALDGIDNRMQYVLTLLTILRDLPAAPPSK